LELGLLLGGNLFFWVKFSPPSFGRFGCSATTKGAMDKRRPQPDSAHQIGLETILVASLIVGWWCFIDGWKCRPEFFTLNVYACYSTTMGPMDKRRPQRDSAHQTGLKPTLHAFLIVVWWCCTEGWRFNQVWAQFFGPAIFCFGLYLHNHWSYGQTEDTGGFSASNWSKTDPPRLSDCSWKWWYRGGEKSWRNFWPSEIGDV